MSLSTRTYRGAGVGVHFDGLDISGDGRTVTFNEAGAFLEALDITSDWLGAWDISEGATGTLVVSEYGLERERFEAALTIAIVREPSLGIVTASIAFQR